MPTMLVIRAACQWARNRSEMSVSISASSLSCSRTVAANRAIRVPSSCSATMRVCCRVGSLDGGGSELVSATNRAAAQPAFELLRADRADRFRGLEAADENERAVVGEVQIPFQRREDSGEPAAQTG